MALLAPVAWYLVVEVLGLLAWPGLWRLCERLPDRGLCFAKAAGILASGLLLWWGTASGLLRNQAGGACLAVFGFGSVSAIWGCGALRRDAGGERPLKVWLCRNGGLIITAELLFLAAFVAWAVLRAFDPAANHTEQPMDLLFTTATWSSPTFPPHDPWLSGFAISYYYGGYWLFATLAHLTALPPEIAYTLGQASWFGMLVVGCFGLGFNMLALDDCAGRRKALVGGAFAATTIALSANLHDVLARLAGDSHSADWWWWSASRVLHDTDLLGRHLEVIDEFPFFSYLLGDNHPHLLAMPFVILAIALALNLYLAAGDHLATAPSHPPRLLDIMPGGAAGACLLAVSCGALVFLNAWDFPVYALLLVSALAAGLHVTGMRRGVRPVLALGILLAASPLLFAPFVLSAQSQVRGLLPNLFHPTPVSQLGVMFGSLVPGLLALAFLAWRQLRPRWRDFGRIALLLALTTAGLLAAGAAWANATVAGRAWLGSYALPRNTSFARMALARWLEGFPSCLILILLLAAFVTALTARGGEPARALRFALLVAAVGVLLVWLPEIGYLRDSFGTRMNTVFKLYYQAWLLLGLASAVGTALAVRRRGLLRFLALASSVAIVATLTYPAAAVDAKTSGFRSLTGLNALAYLRDSAPDEWRAITWIREQTVPQAIVVEAPGTSYRADTARIASATGRATLLGWVGHEAQWRGTAYGSQSEGRLEALRRIYLPPSATTLRQTLAQWHVNYVVLGRAERAAFSPSIADEAVLAQVMDLAFESGAVKIYRRRG